MMMRNLRYKHCLLKPALLAVALSVAAATEAFAQSSGQNYIRVREYTNASGNTYRDKTTYHDGLGRPVQTVAKGITPFGADLVTYQEYDQMGRESNQWIPVPVGGNNGNFVALSSIGAYYAEPNSYARPVYEPSPLNRPIEQYGPGQVWHNAGKRVLTAYLTNVAGNDSLNCIPYEAGNSYGASQAKGTIRYKGGVTAYPTGTLDVVRTTDEDGKVSWEFKDKQGRTLLARQLTDGTFCDTYYVYDQLGNLGAVLPPAASGQMKNGISWESETSTILQQYAYLYLYDGRNRCKAKKIPGCDWAYYVYDDCDQPVFTQDGEQRKRGEWAFTIPDAFNRPVLKGICKNSMGNADPGSLPSDPLAGKSVKAVRNNATNSYKGYSLENVTLASPNVLQVNYYDDYHFMGTNGIPGSSTEFGYQAEAGFDTRYAESAKGMPTGTLTAVLNPATSTYVYLPAVFYYDSAHRVIQAKAGNPLGGTDKEYAAYDFTGQVLQKKKLHSATGKPGQGENYAYTYDAAGRLLTVKHKLNANPETTLVDNSYDELGRLKVNRRNGQANLKSEYAYNVRSWANTITSPSFSQTLHYTDGKGTPCYNGNISSMTWKTGNENTERGYTYAYDGLNRLTTSVYGEGANLSSNPNRFNEQVTGYDKQGNLLGLKRSGKTTSGSYDLVDNLGMAYNGNQLTKATDNAVSTAYAGGFEFKDGTNQATEYFYDANGNLTKDLNKNITDIQYNCLNLPARIRFGDGSTIENLYGADGTKLRTTRTIEGTTTTTDYCGNVVYENGSPKTILTENGFISLNDGKYHYYLQDHQGNNRVVADQNGTIEEVNHYYPFGGVFESTASVQPYKYNGKELDCSKGLDWYDYGARMYDAALGRWHVVDPMSEKYYTMSPYNYCGNEPIGRIDPNGEDIWVIMSANGTFKIIGGERNEDLNIYSADRNGKRTDNVIGKTLTAHSFFDNNGMVIEGAVINPNDQSGQKFVDDEIIAQNPNILSYMPNAIGGKKYDFKTRGIKNVPKEEREQYKYRGMPFKNADGETVYASARDIGNYGAGYIAGKTGLDWSTARMGFDALESYQNSRLSTEGMTTQRAERLGYNAGTQKYGLRSVNNWIKRLFNFPTSQPKGYLGL